ncbi:DNA methylase [Intrasporangium chromatireducens Q5-1]|uniref:Methyltransferase n=1 Tax=Intrasporangium chromatireducens Q5-1 TaxID=584657 RepID=W9GFQ8_9MICO|nr:DNA methyltransferase [Intrasporangium chromatireducens]EWT05041.1 DNA methylase [Intrasporangium chromatireducens Q5-1]
MGLPPYLSATRAEFGGERDDAADEDVHFTEAVATAVIESLTSAGELVLDPFAGFGTTLSVAEHLGRRAVGVELLPERVTACRRRAPGATVIEGDARGLHRLVTGPVDLCLTSPPYRTANDHPRDPLTAYELVGGDYASYLSDLADIARAVERLLRPGGHLVLNVANIRHAGHTTTLAWDVAAVVGDVVPFIGETVVQWDELPHDFTGDYLLTFRREE